MDEGTPVSGHYQSPAAFSGRIQKVTIDVQPVPAKDATAVEDSNAEGLADEAGFE